MLGTNGGGFFNVNAAHPFENPTAVDRGEGSQARDARDPVATARDARLYRHRRGVARGHRLDRQRLPHRFSEVLRAYTSAAANNGSAFGGLTGNTPWFNVTPGVAMLTGRFLIIVPALAIAGSLAVKKTVPASAGSFRPTAGVGLLVGVILIVRGLTFLPALALGPVVEHLAMLAGQTF